MPQTLKDGQEICYPCKWRTKKMIQPDPHRIDRMYCSFPTMIGRLENKDRNRRMGKLIGDNKKERPQWCPIRGDEKAERNASK